MKIYFVRHGKTKYNGTGRSTGHTDIPLIAEGVAQAEQTASELPKDITKIYSSDLIRCKQTTDILNKNLHLPVVYDSRLRERDFGSLAGQLWAEFDPDGTLRAKDVRQEYDYREFGGESVDDVRKRLFSWIDDAKQKESGEITLAVTSAGIIRTLHHFVSGEVHEKIKNSSVHEFNF